MSSYPIAGNYQANVGRCIASAQNLRPSSPSRAGLRDRDQRLAQVVERSSPAYGVLDPEVKRPPAEAESELQYFKEEMERYASEIKKLTEELASKDRQLAAANDEICKLKLGASLAAPALGQSPVQSVAQRFHKKALEDAAAARGGHIQIHARTTREPAAHADPTIDRLDQLADAVCEDPKPIRAQIGHHRCWGNNYNPTRVPQSPVRQAAWQASRTRAGAPYRRFVGW